MILVESAFICGLFLGNVAIHRILKKSWGESCITAAMAVVLYAVAMYFLLWYAFPTLALTMR